MYSVIYSKIFAVLVAYISDSNIQLLLSSWLVKYVAGFGKFSSNCLSGCGGNVDISRVHKVTLLPHVMYPVAALHGKRYPQCLICWVASAGRVIAVNCE